MQRKEAGYPLQKRQNSGFVCVVFCMPEGSGFNRFCLACVHLASITYLYANYRQRKIGEFYYKNFNKNHYKCC